MVVPATRTMTIIAQDPSIKDSNQKILRTQVSIPYEKLGPGPRGYRVHVVDYDPGLLSVGLDELPQVERKEVVSGNYHQIGFHFLLFAYNRMQLK